MASHGGYSLDRFVALCVAFMVLGTAYAASVVAFAPPEASPASPVVLILDVTTDKSSYYRGENMTISTKSRRNNSDIFGDSTGDLYCACDIFFEKWNGSSWTRFRKYPNFESTIRLEPEEKPVQWALFTDLKDFPTGEFRALVEGRVSHREQTVWVYGYAQFTVEPNHI